MEFDLNRIKNILGTVDSTKSYKNSEIYPDMRLKNGSTLLTTLVMRGQTKDVQDLISCGVDLSITDGYGNTALHKAKAKEMAKILLDAGADIDVKNVRSETPFFIALKFQYLDLMRYYKGRGADTKIACTYDENEYHKSGKITPLIKAIREHFIESIEMLVVECDADVNEPNQRGESPIYMLVEYSGKYTYDDFKSILKLLLQYGADINKPDNYYYTPLDCANDLGHSNAIFLLKEKGAKTAEEIKAEIQAGNKVEDNKGSEEGVDDEKDDDWIHVNEENLELEPIGVAKDHDNIVEEQS